MIIIGQISLFINFLAVPWGMGDLSYLTGNGIHAPYSGSMDS